MTSEIIQMLIKMVENETERLKTKMSMEEEIFRSLGIKDLDDKQYVERFEKLNEALVELKTLLFT